MAGSTYIALPMFRKVYPDYFLLFIGNNIGTEVTLNAPLIPDYFDAKSVGLASAYLVICNTLGNIVGSSLVPFLGSLLNDLKWIFFIFGTSTLFFASILCCGLKEVIKNKNEKSEKKDSKISGF